MKKNFKKLCIATIAVMFTLPLCGQVSAQRGMTKEQVRQLLGEPYGKSLNEYGDFWEYDGVYDGERGEMLVRDIIEFDRAGRVMRKMSFEITAPQTVNVLTDEQFDTFCKMTKNASFASDKWNMINFACSLSSFTSKQCAQLMSIFTFDDEKLKVLNTLSGKLVDVLEAFSIYEQFTFDRQRSDAAKVLKEVQQRLSAQ